MSDTSTVSGSQIIDGAILNNIKQMIEAKHFQPAQKALQELEEHTPTSPDIFFLKSWLHECQGDIETAISECEKAIALNPENEIGHIKHALLLTNNKEWLKSKDVLLKLLKKHPDNIDALLIITNVLAQLNEKQTLLMVFLRLATLTKLDAHQQSIVNKLLYDVQFHAFPNEVVNGFIALLKLENIDINVLHVNIAHYIIDRYQLNKSNTDIDFNLILEDDLLLDALPRLRLSNIKIEAFLTDLRQQLLIHTIDAPSIPEKIKQLISSIALNCHLNEYVFYINESERTLLFKVNERLNTEIEKSSWDPAQSETLLLLISMYQSLYDTPAKDKLLLHPSACWPSTLKDIVSESLFTLKNEIEIAQEIESLTSVSSEVSKEVREHYEQNPYPRWKKANPTKLNDLASLLVFFCPPVKEKLPESFNKAQCDILVAGCGTGCEPITTAIMLPESRITAIDISRRSLAYATIKAEELNANNVKFYHADILELPESIGQFDYIKCSGVLHHMQDPLAGWKKLITLLKPEGVMKISLYSEIARKSITKEREKIAKLNIQPTPDNIRVYRQALINQQDFSQDIIQFSDFYSLSECRDLLFHQHEQCFTWKKIAACCHELDLEFLGPTNQQRYRDKFFKQFPEEQDLTNLDKLHSFEESNPFTYRSMYQFLVKKSA